MLEKRKVISNETITSSSRDSRVPGGLNCYLLESILQVQSTLLFSKESSWP